MVHAERKEREPVKSKSVLVRVEPGLSKRIERHAKALGVKVPALFRTAVRQYLEDLEKNNAEVREVIRGIILAKLDRLEREFEQGRMVVFTKIIPINPGIGSSVCVDEEDRKYIVYEIVMRKGDSRLTAIDRFAGHLYTEWKSLDASQQNEFVSNLHSDHVCFTMKSAIQDD